MKVIIVPILFVLSITNANAQKSKFIGDYLLGKGMNDTLTGRLFLSVDSFKFVYQVEINNGKDYTYPVLDGTWQKNDDNTAVFKYNNGEKKPGVFKLKNLSDEMTLVTIQLGVQGFTRSLTNEQLDEHRKHH